MNVVLCQTHHQILALVVGPTISNGIANRWWNYESVVGPQISSGTINEQWDHQSVVGPPISGTTNP